MPVKRGLLAALVLVMLLSACGGPEISLEELRQQAEEGACVLSVDADVDAGRDTWMDFYEAVQAGEAAEVTLVYWYHGDPGGHSRQDSCYTNRLSFEEGVYTLAAAGAENETVLERYACLLRFEEEADADSGAAYQKLIAYVLADDPDLTWREVVGNAGRSQAGDPLYIRERIIYSEYVCAAEAEPS